MDVARPDIVRRKKRNRQWLALTALAALSLMSVGLYRLKPALPLVEAGVYSDVVKRGEMLRQVRGNGTLVPEEIRWVTATAPGRVERIHLLPGVAVEAETLLIELSNPDLVQSAFDVETQVEAAEAQFERLQVQLEGDKLTQESMVASLKSDVMQATIEAEVDELLEKDGLLPGLSAKRSRSRASDLAARYQIEQKRLHISSRAREAQVKAQNADLAKIRRLRDLKKQQVEALKVKAGFAGILQRIGDERPLQIGQQVNIGASIARIANSTKLKAEIRIAETQVRDIQFDQPVAVDTRNGIIPGRVVRIDPAVQNSTVTIDVKLEGPLPKGARPDLSVDATITLERLEDVIFVGRPVNGQADGLGNVFKILEGGIEAVRTQVKFGRNSVSSIEILEGLEAGDKVILSDMTQWERHDRVRLR